ncbi:MAG: PD-(D/E)XK nuclease family protein, partial [Bacteroidia bacterium]
LMGLLESRAVDFETLFVLSVNEGIMPKSSRHQSLIPFGIRKAFGMNTFREDDAVSAYYFYRMLQRAKDIHLYYNTDTDGDSKGEMSRYILQIQQELPNFKVSEHNFSIRSKAITQEHLSIEKTDAVVDGLEQYEVTNGEAKRPLSPSALSTFIKSPMQFYLRYVANFRERDEVLEEMDPITLGNIVHNTLEELYTPHLHQEITHELVNDLKGPKLRKSLEKFLEKEMNLKPEHLQGRNLLFYNICEKLCHNVLNNDAKTSGLRIQALEFDELFYDIEIETQQGPKVIRLKGQFDRLDEVDEQIRVVDYKTGKVEIPGKNTSLFTAPFENGKYAATLQTLFYTLVYLKNNPAQSVVPVIYHLKSTENMIQPVSETPFSLDKLVEYEQLLKQKLQEIWNSDIPFAFDDYEEESKYLMMEVL